MLRYLNKNQLLVVTFIVLIAIFALLLNMEYQRTISSEKETLSLYLDDLEYGVDTLLNERLYNLRGFIPYVQLNPDLTQEDFGEYAKLLLSEEDIIIKDIVLMRDTTVTHYYPIEGNEAIMGVDIADVPIWNEKVLLAKNEGETVIDGPYEIIEGGMGIICRIPFDYYPEAGKATYYGIMNYVVNYDVFLEQTGIKTALENYNLRIEQVNQVDQSQLIIASNYEDFSDGAVTHVLQLPNTLWKFTIEYKEGYNGFSVFFNIIAILAVSVIVFFIISVNTIVNSKEALEISLNRLKEAQDKLIMSEKLAAMGDLTANVAHEINTPLGNSISLISLTQARHREILEKLKNGKLSKKDLSNLFNDNLDTYERININLNRITKLVEDFKRLTSSGQVSEFSYVKLDEFIPSLLDELKHNELKDINIEYNIENIRIVTDPVALKNSITNLFKNSVAHGFQGTSNNNIYINVKKITDSNEFMIEYWDNGVGFDKSVIDEIFTPFYSTKKHKGHSGLGLHIVHNAIVNVLGGSIDIVENERGIFIIRIIFKEFGDAVDSPIA